uniref:Bm13278 n=1 Tax=Brugia malayi TaxID=6279 RepID=A0A1I9G3F6_BRUMA|nr:Bm13278 [Brugia malayi]
MFFWNNIFWNFSFLKFDSTKTTSEISFLLKKLMNCPKSKIYLLE